MHRFILVIGLVFFYLEWRVGRGPAPSPPSSPPRRRPPKTKEGRTISPAGMSRQPNGPATGRDDQAAANPHPGPLLEALYFVDKGNPARDRLDRRTDARGRAQQATQEPEHRVHVMFVPVRATARSRLLQGRRHRRRGNITITPERGKGGFLPVPTAQHLRVVVTGPGRPVGHTVEDLSGQEVYVRGLSSFIREPGGAQRPAAKAGQVAGKSGRRPRPSRRTTSSRW